jgi:predicted metal-dependent hydrolase
MRTSEAYIARFIHSKASWIHKQQTRIAAAPPRPPQPTISYTAGEQHRFQGEPCVLQLEQIAGRPRVIFQPADRTISIQARDLRPDSVERQLKRAYRQELQSLLDQYIPQWQLALDVKADTVRIRAMKRKWGACRPRIADLVFNLELIKYPLICTSYVVLHELAHLIEASHNARFQAILTEHMPDWREVEAMLNASTAERLA